MIYIYIWISKNVLLIKLNKHIKKRLTRCVYVYMYIYIGNHGNNVPSQLQSYALRQLMHWGNLGYTLECQINVPVRLLNFEFFPLLFPPMLIWNLPPFIYYYNFFYSPVPKLNLIQTFQYQNFSN